MKLKNWLLNLAIVLVAIFVRRLFDHAHDPYPADKYRKVIKKGFFYDTVEYHER